MKLRQGMSVDLWVDGSVTVTKGDERTTYPPESETAKALWACASPLEPNRGMIDGITRTLTVTDIDYETRTVTLE